MPRSGAQLQRSATSWTSTWRRSSGCRPQLAAHVDLRRQDRLGAGHRVPRAQGQPALRHHAVAASRATRRARRSGSRCAASSGPTTCSWSRPRVTNGSNTTEQFHFYDEIDTNAGKTAQRPPLAAPAAADRPGARRLGRVRLAGHRARQPRHHVVRGRRLHRRTSSTSISRRRCCTGAAPGRSAGRRLRPGSAQGRLRRDRLDAHADLRARWAAPSCATRWSGWATRRPTRREPPLHHASPGAASAACGWRSRDRIVLKAEYLHNGEYGGVPQIKNDVFTTSLLLIN